MTRRRYELTDHEWSILSPLLPKTRNIAKALQYYDAVKQGQSFEAIAKANDLSTRRVMQIIDLAFLAPAIVQSIVAGDQPIALTTKWLSNNAMPSDWRAQRQIVAAL